MPASKLHQKQRKSLKYKSIGVPRKGTRTTTKTAQPRATISNALMVDS
jgi:hypothetical protein